MWPTPEDSADHARTDGAPMDLAVWVAPAGARPVDHLVSVLRTWGWRPLPLWMDTAERDATLRVADEAGWRVAWLNPGEPVPLWAVEGDLRDARARGVALAERLARSCTGHAAIVVALSPGTPQAMVCVARLGDQTPAWWQGALHEPTPATAAIRATFRRGHDAGSIVLDLYGELQRLQVGRRFFADVVRMRDLLDDAWQDVTHEPDRSGLSLAVLTRLLFLAFVEQKGWLAGQAVYLMRLLLAPDTERLWHTRLHPLFFAALAHPVGQRGSWEETFQGIPFLNGGLFSPTREEQRNPDAWLPDAEVRTLVRTLRVPYRFTDKEEAHGGAIDPHMLGSVFEGLMHPQERARTGAFYTPPHLVQQVVVPALHDQLAQRIPAADAAAWLAGKVADPAQAGTVRKWVEGLRVLDPACGSGAFLVGTAWVLARTLAAAMSAAGNAAAPSGGVTRGDVLPALAQAMRWVVTRNVAGIDRAEAAVRIASLRLWLALAATMPAQVPPLPLPNLAHRLQVGDALWSPWPWAPPPHDETTVQRMRALSLALGEATGSTRQALAAELQLMQAQTRTAMVAAVHAQLVAERDRALAQLEAPDLFGATRPTPATQRAYAEAQRRLDSVEESLQRADQEGWADAFDPRVAFAVELADGGFDLVVGNPPWVRLGALPVAERERLVRAYTTMTTGGAGFGAQPDLSVAFVERAVQLTRPQGTVAMVVPSKLQTAGYAATLRAYVLRAAPPQALLDLGAAGGALFGATAYPAVWRLTVGGSTPSTIALTAAPDGRPRSVPAAVLARDGGTGAPWLLVEDELAQGIRQLRDAHPTLQAQFAPRLGVKTGYNVAFLQPPDDLPRVGVVRGTDVRPLAYTTPQQLLFAHDQVTGAVLAEVSDAVHAHLAPYKSALAARTDARPGSPAWEVFRVGPDALGHRVVWRDIARRLQAAALPPVVDGGPIALNSTYLFAVPDADTARWLATWLNTWPIGLVAGLAADAAMHGHRRFRAANVGSTPLPAALLAPRSRLGQQFRACADALANAPTDAARWEEADALAARLLGWSPSQFHAIARLADAVGLGPATRSTQRAHPSRALGALSSSQEIEAP